MTLPTLRQRNFYIHIIIQYIAIERLTVQLYKQDTTNLKTCINLLNIINNISRRM